MRTVTLPYGTFDLPDEDLAFDLTSGFWDEDLRKHLDAVPAGGNIVDVGAHVGLYAGYLASRDVGVLAIEGHPTYVPLLRRNIVQNGWTYKIAVCDGFAYSRGCHLVERREHTTRASNTWIAAGPTDADAVIAVPLDVFVTPNIPHVDLLKIDAQGADLHVLLGAEQLIARDHPPILIEYEANLAEAHGHTADDYRRWIREHGYREIGINGWNAYLVWEG